MLALFVLPILAAASPLQLSTQPVGVVRLAGDVKRFEATSDGGRAIYLTDVATAGTQELYSVTTDGLTTPVRLNQDLLGKVEDFLLSPDGARVAYLGDRDALGSYQLFIVSSDGSAAPLELSGPLVPGGGVYSLQFSPDGARLVYRALQDSSVNEELYSVRADASELPIKLNGTLAGSNDVSLEAITPDGAHVLFVAPVPAIGNTLYATAIDGSTSPVVIGTGSPTSAPLVSPDSTRAVYESEVTEELFSTATDGSSAPVQLDLGTNVGTDFQITSDDANVVYREGYPDWRLFSVPIAGGSPMELSATGVDRHVLGHFEVTSDGLRAVYAADQLTDGKFELFSVPVGGGSSLRISQSLSNAGDVVGLRLDPTGTRAVYVAHFGGLVVDELFSVPVTGGSVVRLSAPMVTGGDVAFTGNVSDGFLTATVIDRLGTEVLYLADQDADEVFELYRVPIDGHGAPKKVNGAFVTGGDVQPDFRYGRGKQVLFRADASENGVFELFASRSKALREE